jgi:hypothetical protein
MKLLQGHRAAARRLCSVAAAGLLTMLLSAHATPAPAPVPAAAPESIGESPAARGETRLRKLHLVRPDLIPYPIAFEVYC